MILAGIGDDVTGYCTGCRRGGGYQGQWEVILYGMEGCFVESVGEKSYISGW